MFVELILFLLMLALICVEQAYNAPTGCEPLLVKENGAGGMGTMGDQPRGVKYLAISTAIYKALSIIWSSKAPCGAGTCREMGGGGCFVVVVI